MSGSTIIDTIYACHRLLQEFSGQRRWKMYASTRAAAKRMLSNMVGTHALDKICDTVITKDTIQGYDLARATHKKIDTMKNYVKLFRSPFYDKIVEFMLAKDTPFWSHNRRAAALGITFIAKYLCAPGPSVPHPERVHFAQATMVISQSQLPLGFHNLVGFLTDMSAVQLEKCLRGDFINAVRFGPDTRYSFNGKAASKEATETIAAVMGANRTRPPAPRAGLNRRMTAGANVPFAAALPPGGEAMLADTLQEIVDPMDRDPQEGSSEDEGHAAEEQEGEQGSRFLANTSTIAQIQRVKDTVRGHMQHCQRSVPEDLYIAEEPYISSCSVKRTVNKRAQWCKGVLCAMHVDPLCN